MSLQVCHCGWSKVTSYQGLRTHQGRMGCTPKGLSIPQQDQFRYSTPKFSTPVSQIKIEEPFLNVGPRVGQTGTSKNLIHQRDSGHITSLPQNDEASEMSVQVCHCGWSKVTTYHGLRTHQGMMGCTTKGLRNPQRDQFQYSIPEFSTPIPMIEIEELFPEVRTPVGQTGTSKHPYHQRDNGHITSLPNINEMLFPVTLSTINTRAAAATNPLCFGTPQGSYQSPTNIDQTRPVLNFSTDAQQGLSSSLQSLVTKPTPAFAEPQPNPSYFRTPQGSHQSPAHSGKACRALDFYTGAQQVESLTAEIKASRETEREKAKQEQIRTDLVRKTRVREEELAEVKLSMETCKGSLDAELHEINSVFKKVMRVVEDAWQRAVQPLTERRKTVEREAQVVADELQREIDDLKKTLNEFDKTPDVQTFSLRYANDSGVRNKGTINTDFSFGTFRTSVSVMMQQIEQKLQKLSTVELRRIRTFEVDVKLDPNTAHSWLVVSSDGKAVSDGGKAKAAPDVPERFNMFGSILGLNRVTSGKSYWEVEVSNKPGWDLGVTRASANRKGELVLKPDNGYWVIVHYEAKSYAALTDPAVSLSLKAKAQRVGVFVDYEEGLVSFYDVTAQSHIHSFTQAWFGEDIVPYFSPHLKQNEKNSAPLLISAVKK